MKRGRRQKKIGPAREIPPQAPVDLLIEKIGAQGHGLAHLDGKPVFVPLSLAGERVRVELLQARSDGWLARLLEIIEPSPERVTPPCRHFGSCGGCAMQHLAPAVYRAWKEEMVASTLAKRGIAALEGTSFHAIAPASRRRAVLAAGNEGGRVMLGFHGAFSSAIVEIPDCRVLRSDLQKFLPGLRGLAANLLAPGREIDLLAMMSEGGLDLMIRTDRAVSEKQRQTLIASANALDLARLSWHTGDGEPELLLLRRVPQVTFGDVVVDLPMGAFLQPSVEGELALTNIVMAGIGKARNIADLYCGCGTFTFPLARKAKVLGLDSAKSAIAALVRAANHAGLRGRVEAKTRDLDQSPLPPVDLNRFDAVLFDPPRAGAEAQARMLAKSKAATIVAVSCNPSTFARDARLLIDGGYRLESLDLFDQFHWSAHVELVGVFRR